jgi:hypothetical protein
MAQAPESRNQKSLKKNTESKSRSKVSSTSSRRTLRNSKQTKASGENCAQHYILELCHANSYNPSHKKPSTAPPESIRISGYRRWSAATEGPYSRTSLV